MRLLLALLLASLAGTAAAQEAQLHKAQTAETLPCYCRAQGRIFAPGETVCLRTPEGARLAECQMAVNVMSWGMTDRACPES